MPQKFFDIHIEVGDVSPGNFYAKVVLGNSGVKFEHTGTSPASAIFAVAADMEAAGMWGMIAQNPAMSVYPQPGTNLPKVPTARTTTTTPPPAKKDAEPVRKRPADLFKVPKGQCEAICISYDNFGVSKCSSMCRGKK